MFLCLAISSQLQADSLSSIPDPTYSSDDKITQTNPLFQRITAIVYPVLGMPSLVVRGQTFPILLEVDGSPEKATWKVELKTGSDPVVQNYELPIVSKSYDILTGLVKLEAKIPPELPEDTFDLRVVSPVLPGGFDLQHCSVRVLDKIEKDFRIVHITDSQVQDFRILDKTIILQEFREIAFLRPEFVLMSGDVNYGNNYFLEYAENWDFYRRSGSAIFMVPGNHDGYASIQPTWFWPPWDPPGELKRDGLQIWAQTFGPRDFSFDYGPFHFIGLNSYDGPAKRRNSFGFAVENYGGQISPEQLAWFAADALAATAGGKKTMVFSHHDARGPYVPNTDAYPLPIIEQKGQEWNDESSGLAFLDIVGTSSVTHILMGHDHDDQYEKVEFFSGTPFAKVVDFIHTTTMSVKLPDTKLGYRSIEVKDNEVAKLHYLDTPPESIPVGDKGALLFTGPGPNDGTSDLVTQQILNVVGEPMSGVLEFYMLGTAEWYQAKGGEVLEIASAAGGQKVVYVRTTVPAFSSIEVTVQPGPPPPQPAASKSPGPQEGQAGSVPPEDDDDGKKRRLPGCFASLEAAGFSWPLLSAAFAILLVASLALGFRRALSDN